MAYTSKRRSRTHPLSHTDGGVTVVVEFKDGRKIRYPDVKFPDKYIRGVWEKDRFKNVVEDVYVE